jgi:small subunit ribosomal protein S20
MPIIKSAIKRAKQTKVRRSRNLKVLAAIKADTKAVLAVATDPKATDTALRAAVSEIDRAVKKGTLHKNTAARRKSRLVASLKKLAAAGPKVEKPKKVSAQTKPKAKPKAAAAKKLAVKKATK